MEGLNTLSFKDFEVIKELGSGSFGKVCLTRKKSDQKLYSIKSVLMTRLNQKEKQSALNEVRLLASISIANVISYKGSFFNNDNQSLCLVMQYADGGDLEGKINEQFKNNNEKGFEETFIWKVAFELFQGLKTLHRNKIVHRDIKCANVFFVNGIAKLGDLNVSKVLDNGMCSTQTGTPYYTSPEIWKGHKYGRKCDIWSTGCLLYEMCTLHPPFRAKDFPGLYRKVIVGNYDPIPSTYSQQLSDLIRMCLTVDEDMRPDAQDLLETTILGGMELSLEKFRQQQENISLIDPIKCPRVLRFLNNKLPKAKFEQKAKKTVGFVTKKEIELDKGKNSSDGQFLKCQNKVKSEKVIKMDSYADTNCSKLFRCASKNKIQLPPLDKDSGEPLKFSIKRSRQCLNSEKKIVSRKNISVCQEYQHVSRDNSQKEMADRTAVSSRKDIGSRKENGSKIEIGSRKVLRIVEKENSFKLLPDN